MVPEYMVKANMIFYSFRMPLFFILSGLFIKSSLAKRTFRQLAVIKFDNLLYPYFIWAFLQITFQIVFSSFTNANRGPIDYSYIFYEPRQLDQFWYLPALFNVTMLYAYIKNKFNTPIWMQLILGLLFYYLSAYIKGISILSDWMEFYLFFAFGDAVSAFFFSEKAKKLLDSKLLLLVVAPLFILVQLYYLRHSEIYFLSGVLSRTEFIFISLFGCFFMFIVAFCIQNSASLSFLRIIGYHSLYIYVMHVFVSSFIRIVLIQFFYINDPLTLLLSGIILSIPACIVLYNLLIKDNILWFLLSMRKQNSKNYLATKKNHEHNDSKAKSYYP
jgi:fucose 4-O-acetylase-like acetyltransferase